MATKKQRNTGNKNSVLCGAKNVNLLNESIKVITRTNGLIYKFIKIDPQKSGKRGISGFSGTHLVHSLTWHRLFKSLTDSFSQKLY